jgi:hypothetical protein
MREQTIAAIAFIQSHTKIDIQADSTIDEASPYCMWRGIQMLNGSLRVNPAITHPGDLLHEAGHLATNILSVRRCMSGNVGECSAYLTQLEFAIQFNDRIWYADDIAATGWGIMACLALKFDPYLMFASGFGGGIDALDEADEVNTAIAIEIHDKYTTQLFYLGMIQTKCDRTPICWDVSEIW